MYPTKGGVNTGISSNPSFEQWEACIAAGLNVERWESGGYPTYLMAKTIAWYRLSGVVANNKEDAVAKEMKRRNKNK